MFCEFRNIYSFCLLHCTNFWVFAHEYLVDMRYTCWVTNMMKLIVSWVDVSNHNEIRFALFADFEFWIFYIERKTIKNLNDTDLLTFKFSIYWRIIITNIQSELNLIEHLCVRMTEFRRCERNENYCDKKFNEYQIINRECIQIRASIFVV